MSSLLILVISRRISGKLRGFGEHMDLEGWGRTRQDVWNEERK
jgi:hypothetical protein